MATVINEVEVETYTAYGVRFSDGEEVELNSEDEAVSTADMIDGAVVVTSQVYMTPWTERT